MRLSVVLLQLVLAGLVGYAGARYAMRGAGEPTAPPPATLQEPPPKPAAPDVRTLAPAAPVTLIRVDDFTSAVRALVSGPGGLSR